MLTLTLPLLALYLGAFLALSLAHRARVDSRALQLLRPLFPSWRLFEDSGETPQLLYRCGPSPDRLGTFVPCIDPIAPTNRAPLSLLTTLFLNPRGNLALACGSLLQQLVSDLDEADEAAEATCESSVSYQLVDNLVRFQITHRAATEEPAFYQFKVVLTSPSDPPSDLLLSPVHPL